MSAGQVLFNPNFVFHDGGSAAKLFVTLNYGQDGSYLSVLTTSQQKTKSGSAGCHITQFPSNFHFPGGSAFPKDTWLILNSIYEFDTASLDADCASGSIEIKLPLSKEDLCDLLECIIEDEDLSESHRNRLNAFRASFC